MSATRNAGSHPWGKDRYYEHQDAHEYYLWLVNTMMEQLPNDAERLQGIFGVVRFSETECTKCHHKHRRPETEWHITVSCNDRGSLDHKLQSSEVFGEEKIAGVQCDSKKCQNRRVEKRRWMGIVEGPDLLCTQIARFGYNENQELVKIYHHISFRENLDLSPFVETSPFIEIYGPLTYRLYGVVYHAGSLETGHYVSATRTPSGGWEKQDDTCVESISLEQVLAPGRDGLGQWTPYLMFWEKVQSIPFTSPKRSKSRSASLKRPRGKEEEDEGSEAPLGSPPKTTKTSHSPSSESSLGSLFRTPSGSSRRSTRDSSEAEPAKTTPQSTDESQNRGQTDPPPEPEADSGPPPKPKAANEPPKARRSVWDFLWSSPAPDPSVKELQKRVKYLEAELEKITTKMAYPYADLVRTTDLLNRCCHAQGWLIDYYKSLIPRVPPPKTPMESARRQRAWKVEKVAAACFHRASELISMSLRLSKLFALTDFPLMSAEKEAFEKDIGEAFERDELGEWLEAELKRLEKPKLIKHYKK
ncbi:MAG: hypothetical protein LQ342_004689 [Letrouitia transgressa]|nr:MAG: hypothetical protein LQ342_004689 [Letrouitia transgressa]